MDFNKLFGWAMVIMGGKDLLFGIFANDMGGLASLGHTPDFPITLGHEPLRFIIGLVISGFLIFYGQRLITGADKAFR